MADEAKVSGYAVTGIGVRPFIYVDPARAPGVRIRHCTEQRTISIYAAARNRWSGTQWADTRTLFKTEAEAASAYREARAHPGRDANIAAFAAQLRQARFDAGTETPRSIP